MFETIILRIILVSSIFSAPHITFHPQTMSNPQHQSPPTTKINDQSDLIPGENKRQPVEPSLTLTKGIGSSVDDIRHPITMNSDFEAQFRRAREHRLEHENESVIPPIQTQDVDPAHGSTDLYRLADYEKAQMIDCNDDYKSDMSEQQMVYGHQAQKSGPGESVTSSSGPPLVTLTRTGARVNHIPDDDCTCRDQEVLDPSK